MLNFLLLFTAGVATFGKGHTMLSIVGPFPLLWFIGALLPAPGRTGMGAT